MSEPDPQSRRAIISWEEVRAWSRGGQPEPADPPARGWRRLDLDGVFAFALFLPILFGASFGSLTAAIFVGITFAYATVNVRRLWRILPPRLFLLLPAAFAIASWGWSDLPQESLRQGLALGLTVIAALLLSAAQSPGAVFGGVAAAYTVYVIVARSLGVSMTGGMGATGGVAALVALGLTIMALRQRAWLWAAIGMVAVAFQASALVQARPAGSIFALAAALAVVAGLAAAIKARGWIRALAALVAACAAGAAAVNARAITQLIAEHGKGLIVAGPNLDPAGNGWTPLGGLISDQRLLGMGYYGNEAVAAARVAASAGEPQSLAIHNSYVDIVIQLGWLGLWTVGATLLVAVLIFLRRYIRRPNLALAIWAGLLTFELVRVQIEVIGYGPFSATALLLTAALAAAFSPELAARPAKRPPPAPPLPPASVVHLGEYRSRKTEKADPAFRHPDRPS